MSPSSEILKAETEEVPTESSPRTEPSPPVESCPPMESFPPLKSSPTTEITSNTNDESIVKRRLSDPCDSRNLVSESSCDSSPTFSNEVCVHISIIPFICRSSGN